MGWHELKMRAEQFKQKTQLSLALDVMQPTLSSNAPIQHRHCYDCIPEAGAEPLSVGDQVRFIQTPDGIDIYKGTTPVGRLDPGQAALMGSQEQLHIRPGKSAVGIISDVSSLTNMFTVEVIH